LHARASKECGNFALDIPSVLTLVRRENDRINLPVHNDLELTDEDIAEYADGSATSRTNEYTIYDGIDGFEQIGTHLVIAHGYPYMIDAYVVHTRIATTFCQCLVNSRDVSKHYLQLSLLKFNPLTDWFEKPLCYKIPG
jgi:hypothetical protein